MNSHDATRYFMDKPDKLNCALNGWRKRRSI